MPLIRFLNTYEPVTEFYRGLAPALARAGLRSHVVISGADYRGGRSSLVEALAPAGGVTHVPAGVRIADTRLKKLVVLMTYSFGAVLLSLFGRPPALNFFLSQPPLFAAWGRVLRTLRGTPYCCLVMDLYPHVLAASNVMREISWGYRLLRRLMIGTLAAADTVFVIGRCMRDRLIQEGVPADRIVVTPNWANEEVIRPVPRADNALARSFGIGDEFVVLYSGNMGIAHEFGTVLAAAERLLGERDIRFLFLGEGARRPEVEREVARKGLTNVTVGPLQPAASMSESQSLGDVHFVSMKAAFTGLLVPSKAYSALAAGRPLLYEGAADGEVARLIAEHGLGHVVSPGDVEAMVTAIRAMAADRSSTERAGAHARALGVGALGQAAAVERYVQALTALLRAPAPGPAA